MKRTVRPGLVWSAALLLVLLVDVALACPVCGFGQDKARWAFITTTGILTFFPLTMIGGILFWLRQRSLRTGHEATKILVDY